MEARCEEAAGRAGCMIARTGASARRTVSKTLLFTRFHTFCSKVEADRTLSGERHRTAPALFAC